MSMWHKIRVMLHFCQYDFVGSLSGTLGWGQIGLDNTLMVDLYLAAGLRDFVIYVDSGGSACRSQPCSRRNTT